MPSARASILILFAGTTVVKPSEEQQRIIESHAQALRVIAFAGTGKTTTLVSRALANPKQKTLYLAYNKAIQLEAKQKFPAHVRCVTSHALAFAGVGSKFSDAGKLKDKIRPADVVDALGLGKYPEDFRLYVADAALRTVERYLVSERPEIDQAFVEGLIVPGTGIEPGDIVALSSLLWSKMCDLKNTEVGMVHDGYLKLYQLSQPRLNYDCIYFDEAQDANPVTSAIVDAQKAQKVIVGDHHQQLYSFRGATNAMRNFNATQTLHLTRSFRFGQGIADVANLLLSTYKGEKQRIQGTSNPARIGQIPLGRHAFIARTNASVFDEAARAIGSGKSIHFVGGIGGYRFGEALDMFNLWSGNKGQVQNPYLRSFQSFDVLEDFAIASDARELKSLIGLIRRHGSKLPRIVQQVRSRDQQNPLAADLILATAHKSKGLEFENVRLADDYVALLDEKSLPRQLESSELEEINVAYVAATRAKSALRPFADLQTLITAQGLKKSSPSMPEWARPAQITPISPSKPQRPASCTSSAVPSAAQPAGTSSFAMRSPAL